MMDFLKANFDKLLLSILVVMFVGVIVYAMHRPALDTAGTVSFSQDMAKLLAGALLTLITGRALQRNGDTNGTKTNGNITTPSSPTSPTH